MKREVTPLDDTLVHGRRVLTLSSEQARGLLVGDELLTSTESFTITGVGMPNPPTPGRVLLVVRPKLPT